MRKSGTGLGQIETSHYTEGGVGGGVGVRHRRDEKESMTREMFKD